VISLVEGIVAERGADRAVILTGGVGYELHVSANTLAALPPSGRTARVLTHLHVRDDAITVVPGVGKKVAARMVLDLKEKLGGEVDLPVDSPLAEVREALVGMGLSIQEVQDAMSVLNGDQAPVEVLLRRALQQVGAP
jgi:Holliday junction resolvasome RuvABC DNA-binding subunit